MDFKEYASKEYVTDAVNAIVAPDLSEYSKVTNLENGFGIGSLKMIGSSSAAGDHSSANGLGTKANSRSTIAFGEYNLSSEEIYSIVSEPGHPMLFYPNEYVYVCNNYSFDYTTGRFNFGDTILTLPENVKVGDYYTASLSSNILYKCTSEPQLSSAGQADYRIFSIEYSAKLNSGDRGVYSYVVGNGLSDDVRSNAYTLDWYGNAWFSGNVYVGSTSGKNKDAGSKKLATETYVNEVMSNAVPIASTYTATVDTSWTEDGGYFYQDISVSGITSSDNPIVDIVTGEDNAANILYSDAICKVFRITTSDNSIRVWATEAIATSFPIQLKVV